MTISFDTIPTGLRKPGNYIEFNNRLASSALPANVNKVMLIGQKIQDAATAAVDTAYTVGKIVVPVTANGHKYICVTAGTSGSSAPTWPTTSGGEVTDGAVTWKEMGSDAALYADLTPVQLFSDGDAKDYFGEGSMLHLMAKSAIKANPYLQLWAIAAEDGAGVHASGTFVVSGTPTGSGVVKLWIGQDSVEVSFTTASTATTIASALVSAIVAKPWLPVVAKSATGTVTIIAKHAGTVCNQIVCSSVVTSGKGVAVADTTLADGTVDPDINATGGVIDKIEPDRYHVVVCPYNNSTDLGEIKTYLTLVSNSIEQRPGICVAGVVDTTANVQTLADALAYERIILVHLKASKTPPFQIGSAFAAAKAFVTDPAKPLNGLALPGVLPPDVSNRTDRTTQETLLLNGVTPLEVVTGEAVEVVRAVTTYQSDVSYLDVTTIVTLDYVRDSVRDRVKLRFPASKLNDRVIGDVKSEIFDVLKRLEALEIIENVDANKDGLVVERDLTDANRLNVKIPCDVVNGLHILAARIDLIL